MPNFIHSFRSVGVLLVLLMSSALLLNACGEQEKVYDLAVYTEFYGVPARLDGLKDGLKSLGYVEGKNIRYQQLDVTALNPQQGQAALKDWAAKNYDAYWTVNSTAAGSLKQLVSNKPIIGAGVEEPVRAGLVQSEERPGTNLTGIDFLSNDFVLKDLGWMVKINPTIHQVYLLYDPKNVTQISYLDTLRAEAKRLNLTLLEKQVAPQSVGQMVSQFKATEAQAILMLDFSAPYIVKDQLKAVVQREKLMMNGIEPTNYDAGALFIYDVDNYAVGRQSASFVDKVLHGSNPAELPMVKPTKLQLHLNQKLADQLGIKFPEAVLAAADEIVK